MDKKIIVCMVVLWMLVLPFGFINSVKKDGFSGKITSEETTEQMLNTFGDRAPKPEVEPNNDMTTAIQVVSGDFRIGSVNNATDTYDYYKIDLTTSKMLVVIMNFSGNDDCDLDLIIYDSEGSMLDASYYYNPEYVSYTTSSTESGTFYICVEAYDGAGNYEMNISVKAKPTADNNDDFTTADSLSFSAGSAQVNGYLYRNYDRYDVYKVPLHVYSDHTDLLIVDLDTSSNWLDVNFNIWVYDPFGFTCVAMSSEYYDPYESVSIPANVNGTYFIEISIATDSEGYDDSPSGSYSLSVTIQYNEPYENDGNNDPWNATLLSSWTEFRGGSLSVSNVNDFYKVTASNGDFIQIYMNVSLYADFDLYLCRLLPATPMPYGLEVLNASMEWMGDSEYVTLNVNATTAGTIYIVASYWDGEGNYGFNNQPPTITTYSPSNAAPLTLQYGNSIDFSVQATDPNAGTTFTYTWYVNDEEVKTGPDNTFSFSNEYTGTYNITAEVTDGLDYVYVDWQVIVNGRPKITPSPLDERIYMNEGTSRTFSVTVEDPDTPFSYEWKFDEQIISSSGNSINFYADYEYSGVHSISVRVTDSSMLYSAYSWDVLITDINRPPMILSRTPANSEVYINEGSSQTFSINANDPENGSAIYIQWYLDGNLMVDGDSFVLDTVGIPPGVHYVKASVSDSNVISPGENETVWTVTIVANLPPTISATTPSLTWNIHENTEQVFSVTANDPEGQTLSYTWFVNDIQVASGSASYTFIANYTSSGDYVVSVVVSDGVKSSRVNWNLTVIDVSQPPVISAYTPTTSTITVEEMSGDVTFTITANDPDGLVNSQFVSWYLNDSEVGRGFTYKYTPTYESAGVYVVRVVVTDSVNPTLKANMTWILTVQNKNRAPNAVIASPANLAKFKDTQKITFDSTGTSDPDGDELSYKWVSGNKILGTSPILETKLGAGTRTVTLEVRDLEGLSSNASVTLKISSESKSPGMNAEFAILAFAFLAIILITFGRKRN